MAVDQYISTVYKATANGVYRTSDNGTTWADITPEAGYEYVALDRKSNTNVYVIANKDTAGAFASKVWRSTDSGATWASANISGGTSAAATCVVNFNTLNAVELTSSLNLRTDHDGGNIYSRNSLWSAVKIDTDKVVLLGHETVPLDPRSDFKFYVGAIDGASTNHSPPISFNGFGGASIATAPADRGILPIPSTSSDFVFMHATKYDSEPLRTIKVNIGRVAGASITWPGNETSLWTSTLTCQMGVFSGALLSDTMLLVVYYMNEDRSGSPDEDSLYCHFVDISGTSVSSRDRYTAEFNTASVVNNAITVSTHRSGDTTLIGGGGGTGTDHMRYWLLDTSGSDSGSINTVAREPSYISEPAGNDLLDRADVPTTTRSGVIKYGIQGGSGGARTYFTKYEISADGTSINMHPAYTGTSKMTGNAGTQEQQVRYLSPSRILVCGVVTPGGSSSATIGARILNVSATASLNTGPYTATSTANPLQLDVAILDTATIYAGITDDEAILSGSMAYDTAALILQTDGVATLTAKGLGISVSGNEKNAYVTYSDGTNLNIRSLSAAGLGTIRTVALGGGTNAQATSNVRVAYPQATRNETTRVMAHGRMISPAGTTGSPAHIIYSDDEGQTWSVYENGWGDDNCPAVYEKDKVSGLVAVRNITSTGTGATYINRVPRHVLPGYTARGGFYIARDHSYMIIGASESGQAQRVQYSVSPFTRVYDATKNYPNAASSNGGAVTGIVVV